MEDKKINEIEIIAIASEKLEDINSETPSEEDQKDFITRNAIGTLLNDDSGTNISGNSEGGKKPPQ